MCGSIFFRPMNTRNTKVAPPTLVPFTKTYTSTQDLIQLLQSRGLQITDALKAQRYLQSIGYYRLSGYMYPFLEQPKEAHRYKKLASFEKVMMLYRFDKKLRLLIFNEIEKIEVAVRSAIVNIGCEVTGNPFWMSDVQNFVDSSIHHTTMGLMRKEVDNSREDYLVHFKSTYSSPFPPAWILAEVLPFGVLTRLYDNIKNKVIKKRVAKMFCLEVKPFKSWLTIVYLTRNSCCHHARVWNRVNAIRPMQPHSLHVPWCTKGNAQLRIYDNLWIIKYLLNSISPQNDMFDKVQILLANFPEVDVMAMGFPTGWKKDSVWI